MTTKFESAVVDVIVGTYVASVEAGDDYDSRTAVVKQLADEYGVTENVIRGKLVSEGVYVAKEVATKAATEGVSKADLVKAMEAFTGIKNLKSMGNMTKKDLVALWDRLVEMSDVRNAEEGK